MVWRAQTLARAALANEKAAVEMETAAKEWENAALKFQVHKLFHLFAV